MYAARSRWRRRRYDQKKKTDYIKLKTGKIIKLKKHLSCKNFGIYAPQGNECDEYYVWKTITSFSKDGVRIDTIRKIWL